MQIVHRPGIGTTSEKPSSSSCHTFFPMPIPSSTDWPCLCDSDIKHNMYCQLNNKDDCRGVLHPAAGFNSEYNMINAKTNETNSKFSIQNRSEISRNR
jgi:hypothetical protein